ncbi:MAG: YihY family inner membrane protein [Neisseriaceae bacterium]
MSSRFFFPSWRYHQIRRFLYFLLERFRQFEIAYAAASLTLSTLMAIVPTLLFLIYLFSKTASFELYTAQLLNYTSVFLDSEAFNAITDYLQTIPSKIANLSLIGAVILFMAATFLMATVEFSFNKIWQVVTPRPFFLRLLSYILVILIGPLSLVALSYFWNFYFKALELSVLFPVLSHISYLLISIVVYTIVIFFIFKIVPYRYVPNRDAILGALVTASAIATIKKLFSLYVTYFNQYELIYGAFASIPLFIFYIYLLWGVLLAGALFTASLSHLTDNAFMRPLPKSNPFEDAVRILSYLASSSTAGAKIQSIRYAVNMGYDDLGNLLEQLQTLGYVKKYHRHWFLARPAKDIFLQNLWESFIMPAHPLQKDACGEALYNLLSPATQKLQMSIEEFIGQEIQPLYQSTDVR